MKQINWLHNQKWLIKREFWEHKGAAFWTPAAIAAVTLVLSLAGTIFSLWYADQAFAKGGLQVDGSLMALPWAALTPFAIAWVFISFFYSIGSLYEDRKDKSVLFWSSLPIPDSHLVMSKAIFVLFVGPAIALVFASITSVLLVVLAQIIGLVTGLPYPSILSGDFWFGLASFWAALPLYALWAFPLIAWCLMVSAWARTKPFLWAVGVPLGLSASLGMVLGWEWFVRSAVAIMERVTAPLGYFHHLSTGPSESLLSLYGQALSSPSLWIGAVLGGVMMILAILFRKKSAEL